MSNERKNNLPVCRNKTGRHNSSCDQPPDYFDEDQAEQQLIEQQSFKSKNIDQKLQFIKTMLTVLSYFVDDDMENDQYIDSNAYQPLPDDIYNADQPFFNDLPNLHVTVFSATKLQSANNDLFLSDTIRIKPKYDTSGISEACKVAQHLYNDAYYIVRQIAFIINGNSNISWRDLLSNFSKKLEIPSKKKSMINCRIYICNNPNVNNSDIYKQFPSFSHTSLRTCKARFLNSPKTLDELLKIKENEEKNFIEIKNVFERLKNIEIKLSSKNNLSNIFYDLGFLFKYTKNYQRLYSKQSNWVLHSLVSNLKSYYALLNKFNNEGLGNQGEPSFPSYKNSEHRLLFGKSLLNNRMKEKRKLMIESIRISKLNPLSLVMDLHLPCKNYYIPIIPISLRCFSDGEDFFSRCISIIILPRGNYYEIEISYKPIYQKADLNYNKALSIDFGGTNVITSANNCGLNPELIKGKSLKKVLYFKNVISAKKTSTYKICENLLSRYKYKGKSETFLDILDYHINITKQRRNSTSFIEGKKNNPRILKLYQDIENITQLINMFPNDCLYSNIDIKKAEKWINYIKANYDKKLIIYDQFKNSLLNKSIEEQEQFLNYLLEKNKEEYYDILNYSARRMNKETHKITKYVIDYCIKHEIGNIGIGYNKGWKQNTKNMGKRFNRIFQSIPHYTLLQQLKYKAELVGINLFTVPEPYTSQSSAMDREPIEERPASKRWGIRGVEIKCKDSEGNVLKTYITRNLFYSKKSKKYIHSDVNGAFSILRLAFPDLFDNISQKDMLKNPINIYL